MVAQTLDSFPVRYHREVFRGQPPMVAGAVYIDCAFCDLPKDAVMNGACYYGCLFHSADGVARFPLPGGGSLEIA